MQLNDPTVEARVAAALNENAAAPAEANAVFTREMRVKVILRMIA